MLTENALAVAIRDYDLSTRLVCSNKQPRSPSPFGNRVSRGSGSTNVDEGVKNLTPSHDANTPTQLMNRSMSSLYQICGEVIVQSGMHRRAFAAIPPGVKDQLAAENGFASAGKLKDYLHARFQEKNSPRPKRVGSKLTKAPAEGDTVVRSSYGRRRARPNAARKPSKAALVRDSDDFVPASYVDKALKQKEMAEWEWW